MENAERCGELAFGASPGELKRLGREAMEGDVYVLVLGELLGPTGG